MSPSLAAMVLGGAILLLMLFNYHATYVSSMAYSSPSIVIDAGRTSDGNYNTTTTTTIPLQHTDK